MAPRVDTTKSTMNADLRKVLTLITTQSQTNTNHVICLGDFNYPDITWESLGPTAGAIPHYYGSKNPETEFVNIVRSFGLYQMNMDTNVRGATLDLVLTTCPHLIRVRQPTQAESITSVGRHHNPIEIELTEHTHIDAENETQKKNKAFST